MGLIVSFGGDHPRSVAGIMHEVVAALLPATFVYAWFFGWGVAINVGLAVVAAFASEAAFLALRRRPWRPALADGSALVTALLVVLALPPLAPWWLTFIGTSFAIMVGKHLYGGLGYNPFNPAMVGFVLLLVAYPVEMHQWLAPAGLRAETDFATAWVYTFTGRLPWPGGIDAITAATPLDALRAGLSAGKDVMEVRAGPGFGRFAGAGWEWINLAVLAGGLWLLGRRIISWEVPVGLLATLFIMTGAFHLGAPAANAAPLFHLFVGGAMMGAFFVATDPVSGATSPLGRLLFGIGVGLVTVLVRKWGIYPDGVAFGVMLMNLAAPALDQITRPRVYGK